MHVLRIGLVCFTLAILSWSQAKSADDGGCAGIGGMDREATQGAAKVNDESRRVHFVQGSEKKSCPSLKPSCRAAAYVVPGDWVLTGVAYGDYVCAMVIGLHGRKTSGLLPAKSLSPARGAYFDDWYGYWVVPDGVKRITIEHINNEIVAISAELYGTVISGVFHPDGDHMNLAVGPAGKPIKIEEAPADSCQLTLRLVGPYLIADDNHHCHAAAFVGIYERS